MPVTPTLQAFLDQLRGQALGYSNLITNIAQFKAAIEELANQSNGVNWQEEGAAVLTSGTLNVIGASAALTDVSGIATLTITGAAGVLPTLLVTHELANTTDGGTTVNGTQNVRPLNTVEENTIVGASVAINQVTLPAGDYRLDGWAEAVDADRCKLRAQNVTDAATLIVGGGLFLNSTNGGTANLQISGVFTLAAEKVIELQQYTQNGLASIGFGFSVDNGDPEVYCAMRFTKLD